jgi:transcriptional regulator with XRE-family HTH domain
LSNPHASAAIKRLIAARKAYGYSQLETSRIIGLTTVQYREVEQNIRLLSPSQASTISERFSIPLNHFKELIRQEEVK